MFINVRRPASALNTFDDPQDVADTEATDVLNMVFDRGYATPRSGSALAWDKPVGETNSLINLVNATDSARNEYALAIYAPNFYLRDEVNNQWVPINGAYTPSATYKALPYGFAVWNAGVGSDVVYFGNGREDTIKWQISLNYLSIAAVSTDTTLTLTSAAQFPSTGPIVVVNAGTPVLLTIASKLANVLTLSAPVGVNIPSGSAVAGTLSDMSAMAKGKIFSKFQGRLFLGNSYGSETTMYYSNVGTPEDFTVHGTPSGGGFYGFTQGTGEITGILDFGQYLGVLKGDSFHRFEFIIDSTNTTKIDQVTPLVSDDAMGCPYFKQWVKKNTTLYYPSATAGIFAIAPLVTGFQTTIQLQVLDLKIHNLYQSLNFSTGRSVAFGTKILWACATSNAVDTILVFDTLRQYWTRFNNWPVADWLGHNSNLYFGSYQDGKIYKCFDNSYTDSSNPYTAYAYTKRYDFGTSSMPKTETRLFVQGYMNSATTLYCDVLFNEQGIQQKITYAIKGNQQYVVQPITTALGMAMLGLPLMGGSVVDSENQIGLFKVYLALPNRYGFFNIQAKFYSTDAASQWSVTGIGLNPQMVGKSPEDLVINTAGIVPIPSPVVSTQS